MPEALAGSARSRPAASRRSGSPATASRRSRRCRAPARGGRVHRSSPCRSASMTSPMRAMTWPWRIWTWTGWTASAARRAGRRVRSSLNVEFGTTSGEISSAASVRSCSSSPPAIAPERRGPDVGDGGVAQLGPLQRIEHAAGLAPDRRPACRIEALSVVSGAVGELGSETAFSRSGPGSGVRSAENVVSIRRTRCSKATCWACAMAMAFSVVYVYWKGTAAPAASLAACVWMALSYSTGRGATMSRVASCPPGPRAARCGHEVDREDRGQGDDRGSPAATSRPRVTAREAGGRARARVSIVGHRAGAAQCPPTSWVARSARASACATSSLTCLPSARPRVRGESQPMTLPMSRADEAPVAATASSTSASISASVERLRAGTRRGRRSPPPPWRRGPRGRPPGRPRPTRAGS